MTLLLLLLLLLGENHKFWQILEILLRFLRYVSDHGTVPKPATFINNSSLVGLNWTSEASLVITTIKNDQGRATKYVKFKETISLLWFRWDLCLIYISVFFCLFFPFVLSFVALLLSSNSSGRKIRRRKKWNSGIFFLRWFNWRFGETACENEIMETRGPRK